jgi:hypothetical protein
MSRATTALLITLLMAFAACGHDNSTPQPASSPSEKRLNAYYDDLVKETLEPGRSIILVRVVESTFPDETPIPDSHWPGGYMYVLGKALVLRSWWGPFYVGEVLHVTGSLVCASTLGDCTLYPLHSGDELLIFTGSTEPIVAVLTRTWPAAGSDAKYLMATVDRAIKGHTVRPNSRWRGP